MRRGLVVALCAALAPLLPAPADAEEAAPRPATAALEEEGSALRASRTGLLAQVAALSDASEGAHARFVAAQQRASAAAAAATEARRRLVEHAVASFVHGTSLGQAARARSGIFADAVHQVDRDVVERVAASGAEARAEHLAAEQALDAARRAEVEIAASRVALEATIADHRARSAAARAEEARNALARRLAEEAQAREVAAQDAKRQEDAARRAASAPAGAVGPREAPTGTFTVLPGTPTGESGGLPPADGYTSRQRGRFARATAAQAALMAAHPFGPTAGLPPSMTFSGQIVEGMASWYGPGFDGRPTASGAIYDQQGWTVASKELPLGTVLLVTRGERSVLALVNDRGPYVAGRSLDLSRAVAEELGTVAPGVAYVRAQVVELP